MEKTRPMQSLLGNYSYYVAVLAAIVLSLVSTSISPSVTAESRDRLVTTEDFLRLIKNAHMTSEVSSSAFSSYRLIGCMYINPKRLPTTSRKLKIECIEEETGVLEPSFSYVTVLIGTLRITQLIDMSQVKGWQITSTFARNGLINSPPAVSNLDKIKYEAIVENTKHSLLAFLAILNAESPATKSNFEVSSGKDGIIVSWSINDNLNQFFFNKDTFLCDKQVRSNGDGVTILKFSNYKSVANVMLPHTIVLESKDGTRVANREIKSWGLAADWPSDYFTPSKINTLE